MASTLKPKASDTPVRPMPTPGKAAVITALPQPPSTSQKVPKNSAASRLDKGIFSLPKFEGAGMLRRWPARAGMPEKKNTAFAFSGASGSG
jgi:hypothetical protein